MATQEWDWFQREELIGQISDIRVQNLQVERENVQKRTFTRWINLHLEKCNPPLEVKDLFADIQDGKILMALLEVLSGRNLLHEYKSSSHRIFQLNNIAKALKFLEDSNVKLVSIDAAEIADGNPSLVLGLIWNIILFFQSRGLWWLVICIPVILNEIKELTGSLSRSSPSSSLSPGSGGTDSDSSFPPTPTAERSVALSVKDQRKAIRTLLAWVQRKTRKYGVAVQDFAGSWKSGLAFLAVIKAIDPSLVDMKQALEDSMRDNLEKAFTIAHDALHIPRLLEPEDIMVDTPDEQSIVTYVAQFLEHFPELEAEDFVDLDKEAPIESTFVRIKETPSERESMVLFLTEDRERAYAINHETSHPPPSKVFVCDKPESMIGPCLGSVSSQALSDTATEVIHQVIDRVLQDTPGETSSIDEPSSESSILSRNDTRGSNHLPVKKSVHFKADTYHDAPCSMGAFHSRDSGFAGSPGGAKELSKQDGHVLEAAEEKPEREVPNVPGAASAEALDGVPLADSELGPSLTSQSSPSWNGASERAASPGEGSRPRSPLGEDTVVADSLEIKVELQTAEALDKDDYFEGIPLKASKFNSDLADFASTSQAFDKDPSPPEKASAEGEAVEEPAGTLGERSGKAARKQEGSAEPPGRPGERHPPKVPGQEDQDYILAPEEVPVGKKPEVHEKAKRKSPRRRHGEEEREAGSPLELRRELPSNPPSSRISLHSLVSRSEEGLGFKPSPPRSKISVIPHDLFYYPHYEVPLAAVLEAYAEGTEDLQNEELDLEEAEGYLYDLGPRVEEELEASESSCGFLGPGEDRPPSTLQEPNLDRGAEGATPALEPIPLHRDHQQREAADSAPVESRQSQESPNSENLANPSEEKVVGEAISSKKKEKKKHVDHVESSIFIAPGTVRSSDDLEDDAGDHIVPSRTSHSDSSVYNRRHTSRSLEPDHFSYVQLRNAANQDDRRNRMSTRYNTQKLTELILQFYGIRADKKREGRHARKKASRSGEATLQESASLQSDSLTQLVQQPDMVYFILFLWLLVYCLLLFPQLDITRL